jgi:hypothetical protein
MDPLTWAFFFYALVADIPNGMYRDLNIEHAQLLILQTRWYLELLLTTHHFIRLYCRRVSSLRNSWRRS